VTRTIWLTDPGETYNRPAGPSPGAHRCTAATPYIHPGTLIEGGSISGSGHRSNAGWRFVFAGWEVRPHLLRRLIGFFSNALLGAYAERAAFPRCTFPVATLGTLKTKHLAVSAEAVWERLVGPGRRDWYYRLTSEGSFEPGATVRWLDARGETAEQSQVLELTAPRLLKLRTRFLFAPAFAAAPAHELTWALSPEQGGTRVTLSWNGSGPALRLLESEGGALLDGLALAVDPEARAKLERLPEIGPLEIRDLTPELLPEYQRFFDREAFRDYPAWQSCYCMETLWEGSEDEWAPRTAADNREEMSARIASGRVTALLAFDGGRPVAWCHYGESTALAGLAHRYGLEANDHQGVGSVACFVIASQYRGHGVATRLLDEALERLRAKSFRMVEAYPPKESDGTAQGSFRGPLAMYLRAGFEPYREAGRSLIMRKSL
jgi:GNAT superfamily N-acetyltransferase